MRVRSAGREFGGKFCHSPSVAEATRAACVRTSDINGLADGPENDALAPQQAVMFTATIALSAVIALSVALSIGPPNVAATDALGEPGETSGQPKLQS